MFILRFFPTFRFNKKKFYKKKDKTTLEQYKVEIFLFRNERKTTGTKKFTHQLNWLKFHERIKFIKKNSSIFLGNKIENWKSEKTMGKEML